MKKPVNIKFTGFCVNLEIFLAVWTGLEPATPCVTGRYSNQLNYQTKDFALADPDDSQVQILLQLLF